MTREHWLFLAAVAVVGVASWATVQVPTWLVGTTSGLSEESRLAAVNDLRQSMLQLLGGLALGAGLVFTAMTYRLGRSTQRADQFVQAIDQIGSETSTVRTGGIFGLGELAARSPSYWPTVEQVLSSFVREHSGAGERARTDLQSAMTVLGRRPGSRVARGRASLNLRGVRIAGLKLDGGNFENADFRGADLGECSAADAIFTRSIWSDGSRLDGADLSSADFTNAELSGASLRGSVCYRTKFAGANTAGCDFSDAQHLELPTQRDPGVARHQD